MNDESELNDWNIEREIDIQQKLRVYTLYDDVELPEYKTKGSACFDIKSYLPEEKELKIYGSANPIRKVVEDDEGRYFVLWPNETVLIPTGCIFDIPQGWSIRLHSRSGLALKHGIVLKNGEGVIDSDYVEETFVMLTNDSNSNYSIRHKERVAQGDFVPVRQIGFQRITNRPQKKTDRSGGFGSTGTH